MDETVFTEHRPNGISEMGRIQVVSLVEWIFINIIVLF